MVKMVDYGERLFLILLSVPFLLRFAIHLPANPYAIALVLSELLTVTLIMIRKPGAIATSPYPVAIAFAGTALPLLAAPGGTALLPAAVTSALMFAGLAMSVGAKLALNRSFGVVAANRGVKRGGPYRLVRHPMYLGYIITQTGFLLANFSWSLAALYAAAWAAQVLRVIEEERVLIADRDYLAFTLQTRWRVVPLLF